MKDTVKQWKGWKTGAKAGLLDCPGDLAKEIYGERWNYGAAFAYLYRRFGPPINGCDQYKSLCMYVLTTPMDGLGLWIDPVKWVHCSFGYLHDAAIEQKLFEERLEFVERVEKGAWPSDRQSPVRGPITDALEATMKELLRPVNIRDWFINILGPIKDEDIVDPVDYWGDEEKEAE